MRDFQRPGRSPVLTTEGMCATSHPIAAMVAIDLLKRGGNAMDAAIGAALTLGICEPHMTGIGGDCFVLHARAGETGTEGASGGIHALNGSGRAPANATAASLRDAGHFAIPIDSAHSVTIPGAVDAFCHLSETEGRLGLDAVLEPAIRYAEAGVPVAPRTAFDWEKNAGALNPAARRHFLEGGAAPAVGQKFAHPGVAEVLRRIARDGRKAFYEGEVADDMVSSLRAVGGCHAMEDLAATRCESASPIEGEYRGATLVEHPPNGQGATAILMLNILSHFDMESMDPLGAERAHVEAEAAKLAYDARDRFLGDVRHVTRLDHMLSPDTASKLAKLVDTKRATAEMAPVAEAVHKDTVYLAVVDRDRMAVSLIHSIYHPFGSGIASEKFGILFQNRGAGFTLEAGHPNELAGGKRPLHTIIPGMFRDDAGFMPFGVMGGAYQPAGHARFLGNLRDHGMDPQSAIDAPRSFPDAGALQVESGYGDAARAALAEMGHAVTTPEAPLGGAQAIRIRNDGVLEGASDPRKDGCALGY